MRVHATTITSIMTSTDIFELIKSTSKSTTLQLCLIDQTSIITVDNHDWRVSTTEPAHPFFLKLRFSHFLAQTGRQAVDKLSTVVDRSAGAGRVQSQNVKVSLFRPYEQQNRVITLPSVNFESTFRLTYVVANSSNIGPMKVLLKSPEESSLHLVLDVWIASDEQPPHPTNTTCNTTRERQPSVNNLH